MCPLTCLPALRELEAACRRFENKDFSNIMTFSTCPHVFGRSSQFIIREFSMVHSIPAAGYVISHRRRSLEKDYKGTDFKNHTISLEHPVLAFTGDTCIDGLIANPIFGEAEVLVMECTIVDDQVSPEETKDRGHTHGDDIIDFHKQNYFKNKRIVLFHISSRYDHDTAPSDFLSRLNDDRFAWL